jgi:hypothetical protein
MVREGAPSTACGPGHEKGVDGVPLHTMTGSGDNAPLAAVISRRSLCEIIATLPWRLLRHPIDDRRIERIRSILQMADAMGSFATDMPEWGTFDCDQVRRRLPMPG